MGATLFSNVIYDALVLSPVTSLLLTSSAWVWAKIFLKEYDYRPFCRSYKHCIHKKQWWRVLTSPFTHQSFLHLLLNSVTIWSCRIVEKTFGSFFFLKYSLLLIISESLISFMLIYYIRKFAETLTHPILSIQFSMMINFQSFGCSGLALGWLGFLSLYHGPLSNYRIVLFGLLRVSLWYAPLVMIVVYYLFMFRGDLLYNWGGLLSGYLLALGVLQLFPDIYWSVCFIFDVIFIAIASIVSDRLWTSGEVDNNDSFEPYRRSNSNEVIEVISLPVNYNVVDEDLERMQPITRTIDGNEFDVEEVKENDSNHRRIFPSTMIPIRQQSTTSLLSNNSHNNSSYIRLNDDVDMNPV